MQRATFSSENSMPVPWTLLCCLRVIEQVAGAAAQVEHPGVGFDPGGDHLQIKAHRLHFPVMDSIHYRSDQENTPTRPSSRLLGREKGVVTHWASISQKLTSEPFFFRAETMSRDW